MMVMTSGGKLHRYVCRDMSYVCRRGIKHPINCCADNMHQLFAVESSLPINE